MSDRERAPPDKDDAPPRTGGGWRERLHAWWEGYELEEPEAAPEAAAKTASKPASSASDPARGGPGMSRFGKPLWDATRIEVAEAIWGKGFTTPGAEELIPDLVKPLGLNPAMSLLNLGAGLGGAARSMVAKYGCWVSGLEASKTLIEVGTIRAHEAGMAKQASLEPFDPEAFRYPKRVDCVFAKEVFYAVANKEQLFDGVEQAIKPGGQLLFTDYVLDGRGTLGPAVLAWMANEPAEPHLWTLDRLGEALQQRNFDLRITEDISDTHRALILQGISGLTERLARVSLSPRAKLAVVEEVELWARRVAALSEGIRLYRFYALKPV